jgi:hypothetical protein
LFDLRFPGIIDLPGDPYGGAARAGYLCNINSLADPLIPPFVAVFTTVLYQPTQPADSDDLAVEPVAFGPHPSNEESRR